MPPIVAFHEIPLVLRLQVLSVAGRLYSNLYIQDSVDKIRDKEEYHNTPEESIDTAVGKLESIKVTDVTELKYGNTLDSVHKVYLSAILDLCDRRPVAYVIGDSNNNALVFETFDKAVKANPGAHPIFHSDRGYQYTSRRFHNPSSEYLCI